MLTSEIATRLTGKVSGYTIDRAVMRDDTNKRVCIFEYAGAAPDLKFGAEGVDVEHPSFQVVVRGEPTDYDGPRSVAEDVRDDLVKVWTTTLSRQVTLASNSASMAVSGLEVTIVDYSALAGKALTVTIDGASTVLTEGVAWNRGANNGAAATSLASAIDALANVSAGAVGAVVTAVAGTVQYRFLQNINGPFWSKRDEKNRHYFVSNWRCEKVPS